MKLLRIRRASHRLCTAKQKWLKKAVASFCAASVLFGMGFLNPVIYAGGLDASSLTTLIGLAGSSGIMGSGNNMSDWLSAGIGLNGGMPIGGNAKLMWTSMDKVSVSCQLSNTSPEINDTVTAYCWAYPNDSKHYAVANPILTVQQEMTSSGTQTIGLGPFQIQQIAYEKDGQTVGFDKDQIQVVDSSFAQITVTPYEAKTTLGDGTDLINQMPTTPISTSNQEDLLQRLPGAVTPTTNSGGIDDGGDTGYVPINPTFNDPTGNGTTYTAKDPTTSGGGIDGTDNSPVSGSYELKGGTSDTLLDGVMPSSLDDGSGNGGGLEGGGSGGLNGLNGLCDPTRDASCSSGSSGNGSNWNDYINDALGDLADSFGAGDDDWANSNGGNTGESVLDDYFNGVDFDGENVPGGLTNDLLGVADELLDTDGSLAMGDGAYLDGQQEGDGSVVSTTDGDGGFIDGSNVTTIDLGSGNNAGGGIVAGGSNNNSTGGIAQEDFAALYQDGIAGLDGFTSGAGDSSNGGLLGAINSKNDESSLSKRLRQLIGGDGSFANNATGTVSDQDLFDLAKTILLGNGMNLEDLRKGRNYSPNSAWTDPTLAWDFNRITTLLKKHRISLVGGQGANGTNATNQSSSNGWRSENNQGSSKNENKNGSGGSNLSNAVNNSSKPNTPTSGGVGNNTGSGRSAK